ncbi:MAG: peptidoglycan DD-metalloendopeptidase family protein [Candidatus Symbiobacter sp.]|nr:peptidoglycan DD-metalloendopeptidase family protein [Candidatus Symbiobacter sp.]
MQQKFQHFIAQLQYLYQRWFAPRQIIIRQGMDMRAWQLSSRLQAIVSGGLLCLVMWSGFFTISYVFSEQKIQDQNDTLTAVQGKIDNATTQVSRMASELAATRETLDNYRTYFLAMVAQKRGMLQNGGLSADRAKRLVDEADSLAFAEKILGPNGTNIDANLPVISPTLALQSAGGQILHQEIVARADHEQLDLTVARASMFYRYGELEKKYHLTRSRIEELESDIANKNAALTDAQNARRAAMIERNEMDERVKMAERRMSEMTSAQERAVGQLSEKTRMVIRSVESLMSSTGIKLSEMVPAVNPDRAKSGTGGPFVPWVDNQNTGRISYGMREAQSNLANNLDRLTRLQKFLVSVPLISPLGSYSYFVASRFGRRIDPFNGRPALHEGLDMAAPIGVNISATAPGRVVYAGKRESYGNMVEISHGYGISTRYAHMSKILVAPGAIVNSRQTVGLVGQTGRAQGPHLHYEVRIDGNAQNPAPFIKARINVLQQSQ